jgi:hypothetical protein
MSGSDTGFATSEAPCAIASEIRPNGESPAANPARAVSPVIERAAVKARRVMIKGLLRDWRVHAQMT